MKCATCNNKTVKNGKQNGIQRYFCNSCKYSFQGEYSYTSYSINDTRIKILLINGCGIRSISRILEISPTTVITRIKRIAGHFLRGRTDNVTFREKKTTLANFMKINNIS